MSPISSRNSVPPSAVSTRPSLRSRASVKAPRSWPNSSDSSSCAGSAAQLSSTKGLSRRGPLKCSARATSSLPVPVSPRTSTAGASPSCSLRFSVQQLAQRGVQRQHAGGLALQVLRSAPSPSRRRWYTSSLSFLHCAVARSSSMPSLASATGLVRKSSAPAFMASTAISTLAWPVTMITCAAGHWLRRCGSAPAARPCPAG